MRESLPWLWRRLAARLSCVLTPPCLCRQDLARPDPEQVDATLEATRAVIEARVNKTMAANQPKSLPGGPAAPQYIKYTPAKQGPEYNSGASHRIIKMHEVAVDPLQPPKFAHKKVCRW